MALSRQQTPNPSLSCHARMFLLKSCYLKAWNKREKQGAVITDCLHFLHTASRLWFLKNAWDTTSDSLVLKCLLNPSPGYSLIFQIISDLASVNQHVIHSGYSSRLGDLTMQSSGNWLPHTGERLWALLSLSLFACLSTCQTKQTLEQKSHECQ